MYLLNRRTVLTQIAGGAALSLAPGALRAKSGGIDTFTGSPNGFFVDSVVVVGDRSSMVIDAQFTHADATALADRIAATGTRLETIFVTHFHPDHLMGIPALKARFPEARVVAHPQVAALIAETGAKDWEAYREFTGFPADLDWTAPEPHERPLTLEGESFDVLGPVVGDTAVITPVALPQFDAVYASDVVFNGVEAFFAETTTPEAIAGWTAALDLLEARPETVIIPGHRGAGVQEDRSGIADTRAQLDLWSKALAQGTDRESLAAAIRDVMGKDPESFFSQRALDALYPQ